MMAPPAPSPMIWGSYPLPVRRAIVLLHRARPVGGHAGSSVPAPETCCAYKDQMPAPPRSSSHATIAPPAPSLTILGVSWLAGSAHTSSPFTGQPGAVAPEASTRITYTSHEPVRLSCQVMNIPPAPSVVEPYAY